MRNCVARSPTAETGVAEEVFDLRLRGSQLVCFLEVRDRRIRKSCVHVLSADAIVDGRWMYVGLQRERSPMLRILDISARGEGLGHAHPFLTAAVIEGQWPVCRDEQRREKCETRKQRALAMRPRVTHQRVDAGAGSDRHRHVQRQLISLCDEEKSD